MSIAGTMGLKANLTGGEIVEQLVYASQIARVRNVVFMGMGEPLDNYTSVKVRCVAPAVLPPIGLSFNLHTLHASLPEIIVGRGSVVIGIIANSPANCMICKNHKVEPNKRGARGSQASCKMYVMYNGHALRPASPGNFAFGGKKRSKMR
jgi:hypothetical protein